MISVPASFQQYSLLVICLVDLVFNNINIYRHLETHHCYRFTNKVYHELRVEQDCAISVLLVHKDIKYLFLMAYL